MTTREIIRIDESLCTGCGECVPACAEGALEIIDGKARVVAEVLCDGLGACLGECPEGALTVEVREADEFDEVAVERRLREVGRVPSAAAVTPHVTAAPHMGCPGSLARELRPLPTAAVATAGTAASGAADAGASGVHSERASEVDSERASESLLQNWPVQLTLVNPNAPFLRHSDLLIAADCAPAAYRLFHEDFLEGRSLVIACPKLDDAQAHYEKLTLLLQTATPRSVSVVRMEVPCCSGLVSLTRAAVESAELDVRVEEIVIGVGGERLTPQAAVR
ncbi:MAG TPA: 4Fe-4S binding protein [Thermoleophilia bacterium]|nr:4Fe-4S binding protein [Thermoleophilia bacterium]